MDKTGIYDYMVFPRDVDFSHNITLTALGDYILQAAGEDADRNGFGLRDLNVQNASWVLSRFCLEMDKLPIRYERFSVRTWVSEVSRVMTTRNMELIAGGHCIGQAVTQWAMIDLDSRRPLDLRRLPCAGCVHEVSASIEPPARLPRIVEPDRTQTHAVVYSDIDFNRHVNSMKYLEWMVDMLPVTWIAEHRFVRFDLNYVQEARYGEPLEVAMKQEGAVSFVVSGPQQTDRCRARLCWE